MPQDHEVSQFQREDRSVLRIGQILDDRFEIVAYLGCGGMGSVYKARQAQMDRDVALKILHPRFTADASAVKRFQREAQIISALHHKHILSVYSFGGVNGLLYLAMEFVHGNSLGQLIEQKGRIKPEQAMPLFLEICDAMAYAHKNGVLHRDLKPDNVMILKGPDNSWTAKVVDFGLAKLLDSTPGQRLTRTGEVVGDPRYMSPQQCKGEKLDVRDDVYSFGCLMYEVLTGEVPFNSDDAVAIMHKHLSESPKVFAQRFDLPNALEAIALTAMAKEKGARYESFDTLAEVLARFCNNPDVKIALPPTARKTSRAVLSSRTLLIGVLAVVGLIAASRMHGSRALDHSTLKATFQYTFATNTLEKLDATTALADCYARQSNFEAAEKLYKEAVTLAVSNNNGDSVVSTRARLGGLYVSAHRSNDARNAYTAALLEAADQMRKRKPNHGLLVATERALQEYGAIEPLRAAQVAHDLAKICDHNQWSGCGERLLVAVVSIGPLPVRIDTNLALASRHLRQKDAKEGQAYYDRVVELTPSIRSKLNYMNAAVTESIASGHYDVAIYFIQKQLALSNRESSFDSQTAKLQLADCYFRMKDYRKAREYYQDFVTAGQTLSPSSPLTQARALHEVGECSLLIGDSTSAENSFRAEVALLQKLHSREAASTMAEAMCALGLSLSLRQQYSEAKSLFDAGLKIVASLPDSESSMALKRKIDSYATNNRAHEQEKIAQNAVLSGKLALAEQSYRNQLTLSQDSPAVQAQIHCSLGVVLRLRKNLVASIEEFDSALDLLHKLPKTADIMALEQQVQSERADTKVLQQ